MMRKTAVSLLCATLLLAPAFAQAAADVETVGNLKVTGGIDNTGGTGITFPDASVQTKACSACAYGILSISLGGTGGATDAAARANLAVPGLSTANTFTASPQMIEIGVPTFVGLAVKGAPGQSANLQEWRNSDGTAVMSVGSGGGLAAGNITFPATTATTGIIRSGTATFIHGFGANNFFAGRNAGNLTMTGSANTGIGEGALYSDTDGSGNTATGSAALYYNTTGYSNTAFGQAALDRNTSGSVNTAVGYAALFFNTIGNDNTAAGYNALASNTTASFNTAVGTLALGLQAFDNGGGAWSSYNTAVGFNALYNNQPTSTMNGYMNTGIGGQVLYSNTTGYSNTASGFDALYTNTTGYGNTANGNNTLISNNTGNFNTASGNNALYNNSTGSYNTAFGAGALYGSTGNTNVAIGINAGSNLTTGNNNIYIGGSVQPAASSEYNTTRIGNSISSVFISGVYGSTVASGSAVFVNSSGQLGTITSSRRYKEDIREMGDATDGLMKLRPVTFYYKREYDKGPRLLQYGLIAEEVEEVYPGLVQYNKKGEPNTVYYQFVNAMLLNEVQKQHRRIEEHAELITLQGEMIRQLKAEIEELRRVAGK